MNGYKHKNNRNTVKTMLRLCINFRKSFVNCARARYEILVGMVELISLSLSLCKLHAKPFVSRLSVWKYRMATRYIYTQILI